ncbi:Ig-like domain-containing protein [Nocardioides sp.]|uniref:Ig-like domain-containing protein n=1 Tax=Nocardioides sp. TaxID=35761 RepID=UPI003528EECC
MSGRGKAWRRRTAGVVANLTLLATASGAVVYAVQAHGFDSHEAELNDGGIWVTNTRSGYYGRINKPIGQQDASTFAALGDELDLVQEDSVVVGVEGTGHRLRPLDPATATAADDAAARLPRYASVQLAGGSLAVLDTTTGAVRAQRVDPDLNAPQLTAVDTNASPLATVKTPASLAVTQSGTVLVASADDTVTRLAPAGGEFVDPTTTTLDEQLGEDLALTAVGEVPVVLDGESGTLVAQGQARAVVGEDAVLQAPGPDAGAVLVATPTALLSVDLTTGSLTTVYDGASGRPTPPVRLGACSYAAWSGGRGLVVTQCGSDPANAAFLQGEANDLVFRVNRGQIVLNDRFSGRVWNIDSDEPRTLDDWPAFNQQDNNDSDDKDTEKSNDGDRRPPKAVADTFGARPGRTTTLYPLDNDSAPAGRVLAIRSVEPITRNGAKLSIGPDGQTVQLKLRPGTTAPTSFEYFIDDGREISAHARVTVTTRRDDANRQPTLRDGFKPRTWAVPAGGSLELPVLPDWRDRADGDALALASAQVTSKADGAAARTTASGRVRFIAPPQPGKVTVKYAVTDGRSEPVPTDLTFNVQDPERDRAVAADAEPDITSVETGRWVTVRPLANDLPGSDPLDPGAQLQLAGKVGATGGAQVRTDLSDGTVSFRASVAKSYTLDYDAGFGTAPLAHGKIRIDVRPRERRQPVAMPDSLTLYGTAPGIADVLANDHDPAGGLLMVQRAWALDEEQVDVAIIDGRWVRVSARQGQLRGPQIVRYAVSNGSATVVGEVTVNQRPAPDDDAPVTVADEVTVRAGASVSIPVLDNDYAPSGDPLSLVTDIVGEKAGQLTVVGPDGSTRMTGTATVAGRLVRYVAPEKITDPTVFTLDYVAANTAGATSQGQVSISVVPLSDDNSPPEPPVLEARTVAGGTVVVKLPGAGVDPDGDAVSLVGLGSAPGLGRVTKLGANTIEYQAFPDSSGTDEFEYTVTDTFGLQATGTARVAVAPAGPPQPPLAVPDTITVEPGRVATVTPTANDFIAPGDRPAIELVDPPEGVHLESPNGPVTIQAPAEADGRTIEVVYLLDNGLTTSQSTITLRTAEPFNNPPVVFDAYGASNDSPAVKVDVLRTAYDPDGPTEELRITDVFTPPGAVASVDGGKITVTRGDVPMVVPFRVVDADGGAAIAQLYVPPRAGNLPFVKADAVIRLAPGQSGRVRLDDYIVSPGDLPLRLVAGTEVAGSPKAGVNVVPTGVSALSITAAKTYQGPGAVTLQVMAGTDQNDQDAPRAWVSIPVQVGQNKPILTCPTDTIEVPQGSAVQLDIAALCNVWTPDPDALADLAYTSRWRKGVDGLEIVDPTSMPVELRASGDAKAGSEAVLQVRAGKSDPGELRVRVVKATGPVLAPIRVTDLRAGESRTVDLAPYLSSKLPRPQPTVVKVTRLNGTEVRVDPSGSSVRISAGAKAHGEARFRVVMSDVAGGARDRQAANILSLELLGVPDRPAAPVPGLSPQANAVHLTWAAPDANGSPIDLYELRASNGHSVKCASTGCDITGLANGQSYTFTVRARNAIGWSDWSPASAPAQPDEVPGRVSNIHQVKTGDRVISIAWDPPAKTASQVDLRGQTGPAARRRPAPAQRS